MSVCFQRISSQCQNAISSFRKCDAKASISSALEVFSSKAQNYIPSQNKQFVCGAFLTLASIGFLPLYFKTFAAAATAGLLIMCKVAGHSFNEALIARNEIQELLNEQNVKKNVPPKVLTANERKSEKIRNQGWKEFRKGDLTSSYATFTRAEELSRLNYYAVAGRGLCSLRSEKYEEALQCAAVLLTFSDTEATRKSLAYYLIGETFYLQKKYQDAEEFFNLAIQCDDRNIHALARKAEITQSPEDASKVIAQKEVERFYVSPTEKEKCLEIAAKILTPVSS